MVAVFRSEPDFEVDGRKEVQPLEIFYDSEESYGGSDLTSLQI